MKDKLIYIILFLLIINVAWTWLMPDQKDYNYYKTEYKRLNDKVLNLGTEIKHIDYEINRVKSKLVKSDSTIDNANSRELDSLFSGFFERAR